MRGRTRTWLTRGALVPLVAVVVGVGVRADAAPEQVLQSVEIDLGSDGTITDITSESVRKADGSDASADETSFDPAETARDLPVRVLTTYRLGDRVGTDLEDLEGESGRVVIDVTVQNTTVRPELLGYDSAGVRKQQYALVGTPLTVIASADLGKDNLGKVVTTADGDAATNGVLSQSAAGSAQVQWAAMLAPPRLAPSATFTLVQDTEDFQVPDIDVSVQPGLVTDPSVQQLLRSAFADDQGSTLQMETQTIGLIGEVNTTLTGAAAVLADIQESLAASAGDLGRRAISDLQGSASALSGSLEGVATDIGALETEISGSLDGTSSRLMEQLGGTLNRVQSLLGDPARAKAPGSVVQRGCDVVLPGYRDGAGLSVFEHILQVQARLEALKTASANCGEVIEANLIEQLGEEDAACTSANRDSAICVVDAAGAEIAAQADGIEQYVDELGDLYQGPAADRIDDEIAALDGEIDALAGLADALAGGGLDHATGHLDALDAQLARLEDDLADLDVTDLLDRFSQVRTAAVEEQAAIDALLATGATPGAMTQLSTFVADACDLPAYDATVGAAVQDYLDETAAACNTAQSAATTVADALRDLRDRWDAVEGLTAVSATGADLTAELQALATAIDGMQAEAAWLRGSLDAGDDHEADGVQERIDQLVAAVDGLGSGTGNIDEAKRLAALLALTGADLDTQIGGILADLETDLRSSGGQVLASIEDIDSARASATTQVQRLTRALGTRMSDAGQDLRLEGEKSISASNGQLDDQVALFGTRLDTSVEKVVNNIGGTVSAANRSLGDTEKQLASDLAAVLVDLGDPESGSGGLLGALRTNAGQTALSTRQVAAANDRAAAFGNVRSAALDDVYLQQEQLSRSLEMQEEFPGFGLDLPGGSRVLTVFTFHLGAN